MQKALFGNIWLKGNCGHVFFKLLHSKTQPINSLPKLQKNEERRNNQFDGTEC